MTEQELTQSFQSAALFQAGAKDVTQNNHAGAAAVIPYKYLRVDGCKLVERDARAVASSAARPGGELVRLYDFDPRAPHAIREEIWHQGGKRVELTAFRPLTGLPVEIVAKAYDALLSLGGTPPPPLQDCLNPAAHHRALEEMLKAEVGAKLPGRR